MSDTEIASIYLTLGLDTSEWLEELNKATDSINKQFVEINSEFTKQVSSTLSKTVTRASKQFINLNNEFTKQMSNMGSNLSNVSNDIVKETEKTNDIISKQMTVMSKNATKNASGFIRTIRKKLVAAFGTVATGAFIKSCIEVGSNVTEVQNVVDTAFKDLSWQADQWASNAMTNFGLSELSAKKYMGVFGQMSNAIGITGKAALDMAENVTGLTGDVASFYNLGTDEAYTKLKSIWTGETETLKDLGVIMTQTNLDQYALNNGFGKTTAKMTEQEKVMLRYQYVTSALSNATGDFVKTQDSWANQTRILTLRFQQLKASLGKGFIALFTPILRGFNSLLAGLQKVADGFASFVQMLTGADISSSMGSISADIAGIGDDAGGVADNVSGIGDAAKKTANDIEKSLAGFDQINKLTEPTDDSSSSGSSGTDTASGSVSGMGTNVSNEVGKAGDELNKFKQIIEDIAATFKEGFKKGLGTDFEKSIKRQRKLLLSIKDSLIDIFTDRNVVDSAKNYFDSIVMNAGRITGSFVNIGTSISENLLGGIDKYLSSNKDFIKIRLSEMFDARAVLWNKIGDFSEFLSQISEIFRGDAAQGISADLIGIFVNPFITIVSLCNQFVADLISTFVDPVVENTDKIKQAFESTLEPIRNVLDEITAVIEETCNKAVQMYDEHISPLFDTVKTGLSDTFGKLLDVYNTYFVPVLNNIADKLKEIWGSHIEPLMTKIIDIIGHVADVIKVLWENILKPVIDWIVENVIPKLAPVMDWISDIATEKFGNVIDIIKDVLSVFDDVLVFVKDVFSGNWSDAWNDIVNTFSDIFSTIGDIAKGPINMVIGLINGMLDGLESGINWIVRRVNALSFDVPDWVPVIGGDHFGFDLPEVGFGSIPYLAEGGYVKPNTPQLAMIGDNRHQGEVVAPEDKLIDMAQKAAAMASSAELLSEAISILKQILKVLETLDLDIQLDGKSLKKYVVDKINEHTKQTGKCEIIH